MINERQFTDPVPDDVLRMTMVRREVHQLHPETEEYLFGLKALMKDAALALEDNMLEDAVTTLKEIINSLNIDTLLLKICAMDKRSEETASLMFIASDIIGLYSGRLKI